jgi:hypothetical protein
MHYFFLERQVIVVISDHLPCKADSAKLIGGLTRGEIPAAHIPVYSVGRGEWL